MQQQRQRQPLTAVSQHLQVQMNVRGEEEESGRNGFSLSSSQSTQLQPPRRMTFPCREEDEEAAAAAAEEDLLLGAN